MVQTTVNGLFSRFEKTRVLVVGDLMLDEFIWGKVSRISPEAPVPVVWTQTESVMPGGAANVANNIRSLGGQAIVAGVVGNDRWGKILLAELETLGINTNGVVTCNRPTTVKTRVIAHHQQVVRVDREERSPLSATLINQLSRRVQSQLKEVDAVVIEDYGKGTITRALLKRLIPAARALKIKVIVDPKEDHFDLYQGVTALTPNRAEAAGVVGRELEKDADIERAGKELVRKLKCEAVLITLGEDGMCLVERSGKHTRIPTVAREVFDVAGAGDTVIAVFALAVAGGTNVVRAAEIANQAAGIVVGKVGVGVINSKELRARLEFPAKPTTARSRQRATVRRRPSTLLGTPPRPSRLSLKTGRGAKSSGRRIRT